MGTKFIPGRVVEVYLPQIDLWLTGLICDRAGTCLIERQSHDIYGGCRVPRTVWTKLREPEFRREYCDVDQ